MSLPPTTSKYSKASRREYEGSRPKELRSLGHRAHETALSSLHEITADTLIVINSTVAATFAMSGVGSIPTLRDHAFATKMRGYACGVRAYM